MAGGRGSYHERLPDNPAIKIDRKLGNFMTRIWTPLLFILFCLVHAQLKAAPQQDSPSTAAQAAQVLDLSTFALIEPLDEPNIQIIARQQYRAQLSLPELAQRLQKQLADAGCQELDGASYSETYGSGLYRKADFLWSVSLSPGKTPQETRVNIVNHGNVDLEKLPIPNDSTVMYSFPNSISYKSDLPPEDLQRSYREQWLAAGWELFGETTVSFFVKRQAVIVQVMIQAGPAATGGKTMVQLTSELMSADLPVPPYSGTCQYSDANGSLLFDSNLSQDELVAFFKQTLGERDWKATTELPIKINFRHHLIFRNPNQEYLELQFQNVEGKVRTDLRYQNARQFAEREKRANKQ